MDLLERRIEDLSVQYKNNGIHDEVRSMLDMLENRIMSVILQGTVVETNIKAVRDMHLEYVKNAEECTDDMNEKIRVMETELLTQKNTTDEALVMVSLATDIKTVDESTLNELRTEMSEIKLQINKEEAVSKD